MPEATDYKYLKGMRQLQVLRSIAVNLTDMNMEENVIIQSQYEREECDRKITIEKSFQERLGTKKKEMRNIEEQVRRLLQKVMRSELVFPIRPKE